MKKIRSWLQRLKFNLAYLKDPPWDSGVSPPELVDFVKNHSPGTALDLGCGTGTNVLYLARHRWTVDGIDFSRLAIRQARRRIKKADVKARMVKGDVTRLQDYPLRPPFDLAVDIGCLHALGTLKAARAYADGLIPFIRPGGDYLLYTHELREEPEDFPDHGLTYSWVNRLFSDSLELLEYRPGTERDFRSAWYFFRKPVAGSS